jgi:NAD(P)H-hydrate epimerase
LIRKHDVTVIGMGLGRESETAEAVSEIIRSNPDARFVIDADALHALAMPMQGGTLPIITPHAGEFRMLGGVVSADLDERCELVMEFSARNRVVTLLKGNIDVISDGRAVRINRTGNPGMTVGGTGDVLAGVTGAIFANAGALAAASAGALIVGTAGDLAFLKYGYGLLATDVIECIPDAMRR